MDTTLNPYLNFNGNCKEAMEFYKSVLGGKLDLQTFGQAPMPSAPDYKDKILHSTLTSNAISFMASDCPPNVKVTMGDNINMSLVGKDEAKLTEIFNKLGVGGKVTMPLEKQFWGDKFGMLTDKFGIHWMVNITSGNQQK